ncbi:MAG: hypothetical protein JWO42_3427 [Chloroflexi bacterium]|jgi:hypothetical protein|nr:hypothetical protein [Chloroflexota bacterium]
MNEERRDPIMPSIDPENEPSDSNPVPQSPTDPKRRTDGGEPASARDRERAGVPGLLPGGLPWSGEDGERDAERE